MSMKSVFFCIVHGKAPIILSHKLTYLENAGNLREQREKQVKCRRPIKESERVKIMKNLFEGRFFVCILILFYNEQIGFGF